MAYEFDKTSIGSDYLKAPRTYTIDVLLDYLSGLMKMREEQKDNGVWQEKYANEIEAVKFLLLKQTTVS